MDIGWEWGVPQEELLFIIDQSKRAYTFAHVHFA